MATKSPLRVIRNALAVGRDVFRLYGHRRCPKLVLYKVDDHSKPLRTHSIRPGGRLLVVREKPWEVKGPRCRALPSQRAAAEAVELQ
jgi:hypothetical protein